MRISSSRSLPPAPLIARSVRVRPGIQRNDMAVEAIERSGKVAKLIRPEQGPAPAVDPPQKHHHRKKKKNKGFPKASGVESGLANKYRAERLAKRTPAELAFQAMLDWLDVEYVPEKVFHLADNGFRIADFYLPGFKVVVEIDGGYHFTAKKRHADQIRSETLKFSAKVTRVIRFTNEEVLAKAPHELAVKLLAVAFPPIMKVFGDEVLAALSGQCDGPRYGLY